MSQVRIMGRGRAYDVLGETTRVHEGRGTETPCLIIDLPGGGDRRVIARWLTTPVDLLDQAIDVLFGPDGELKPEVAEQVRGLAL